MKSRIEGENLPVVICEVENGEVLFSERGGMGWMTSNIEMSTNMEGGLFGGIARSFSGESVFLNSFTCKGEKGEIAFPSSLPGQIMEFDLKDGESIIAQKGAFLCGERSVKLEVSFKKKLGAGLFGGEGFIMQKISGPGKVYLEIDGSVSKYELKPGEELKVDTGYVAAMESSVQLDIEMVKGLKNIVFGGEGLFLTTVKGPGTVWLQTMPESNLASRILRYMPTKG